MLTFLLIAVISYLLGSLPTSIICGRLFRDIDIREHGSGNAGATNVYRVMGPKIALFVLLVDAFKGYAAVRFIAPLAGAEAGTGLLILAGFSAIVGHVWTVFAGFRGGKGVGTSLGVFIALLPIPALVAFVLWLIMLMLFKYVSVASIAAGTILPIVTIWQWNRGKQGIPLVVFATVVGVLMWLTHIKNIQRLRAGTELRIGKKKND